MDEVKFCIECKFSKLRLRNKENVHVCMAEKAFKYASAVTMEFPLCIEMRDETRSIEITAYSLTKEDTRCGQSGRWFEKEG